MVGEDQARMHQRNGDAPYASATEAMRYWPETATAVAVRWQFPNTCQIAAPSAWTTCSAWVLRPTPSFTGEKRGIFEDRVHRKQWTTTWPRLRTENPQRPPP